MQQARVVEDQAVPRLEAEVELQLRPFEHLGKGTVGGVESRELFSGESESLHRAVVESDLADAPDGVCLDEGALCP